MTSKILLTVAMLSALANGFVKGADEPAKKPLAEDIVQQVEKVVQQTDGQPVTIPQIEGLFRAAVLKYGNVEPLLTWLAKTRAEGADDRAQALAEIETHIAWKRGEQQVSYASPILADLHGVPQILTVNESNFASHDPKTGHVLWTHAWPGSSNSSASVAQPTVLPGNKILLSKSYGVGGELMEVLYNEATNTWATKTHWKSPRVLKTKFSNLVVYGGHAYALSDGILECVEIKTGDRQWKKGRYKHGQMMGVDDLLIVQAEEGDLLLIEASPEGPRELGKIAALNHKSWAPLCLAGRHLLLRNAYEAVCYELP